MTAINGDGGNSILIANGGAGVGGWIQFTGRATGGTAQVKVYDNGNLDPACAIRLA